MTDELRPGEPESATVYVFHTDCPLCGTSLPPPWPGTDETECPACGAIIRVAPAEPEPVRNLHCFICGKKRAYVSGGGRVPLCDPCRERQGVKDHPARGSRVPLRVVRTVYEDDPGSPIDEDTTKGRYDR